MVWWKQLSVWEEVLSNALKSGEINDKTDIKSSARLLESIYIDSSFLGIAKLQGADIKELKKKDFENFYCLLRFWVLWKLYKSWGCLK